METSLQLLAQKFLTDLAQLVAAHMLQMSG
jgi:hypothetical protein